MNDIKTSIKNVISLQDDLTNVKIYAMNEYYKYFEGKNMVDGSWRGYDKYEIISETELKIHYKYGAGDVEYRSGFIIKID